MRETAFPNPDIIKGAQIEGAAENITELLGAAQKWFDKLGKKVGQVVMLSAALGGFGGAAYEGYQAYKHASSPEDQAAFTHNQSTESSSKPEVDLALAGAGLIVAGSALWDYKNRQKH